MRILADTSAYSAFMQGHAGVVRAVQEAGEIFVNPVVLGELRAGFLKGNRVKRNLEELRRFLASPRVETLDIDEETAERYAVIANALRNAGTPIPTNDLWIVASAMQHGLRIVTLDAHFLKAPQVLVDHFGQLS